MQIIYNLEEIKESLYYTKDKFQTIFAMDPPGNIKMEAVFQDGRHKIPETTNIIYIRINVMANLGSSA